MKTLIIIPTLNEGSNIEILLNKIIKLKIKLTILIIDDNSKDQTRSVVHLFKKKYKFIKYIFRPKKLGIGSAHKKGFDWAFKHNYDVCITMDADLTHNPLYIKKMLRIIKNKNFSIINTSRFILNNSIQDWPILRKLLTKFRYYLVKIILGTKLDSSGGFRCYNLSQIKRKHFFISKNNSYFFLIESLFFFEKKNYKIFEISLTLPFRLYGSSKMNIKDIFSSFVNLIKLKLIN